MATLFLSLLGSFNGTLDDEPLTGFRTSKVQALLIYLAAESSEVHRREFLMTLLWPDLPESSARLNLRQIIYHLRRSVPELSDKDGTKGELIPLLISDRHRVGLNPKADIKVDIHRFSDLISQTLEHEHLDLLTCEECQERLTKAVELYRGDFLADFYLVDSNAFEEWSAGKRETLRRQALDALETLTSISSLQRSYKQARGYAERQLEIDNLRESAVRQLMEIMALSGQRSEALALFESFRRLLARELGMEPSFRTSELYQRIQEGEVSLELPPTLYVKGFELREEIGTGAYGLIQRAYQHGIGREVAVKIILPKFANDPDFIRRFEAEAQMIARLEHPHIVPIYDYWREPDGAYLVMRLLRGGSLQSSLKEGPWPPEKTLQMMDQVASALSVAHRQGIVHRDVKPANILLDEEENAYLSDFGIAKDLTSERQLTATGAVIGTPDYISPEQILNETLSPRTDLYSLGLVLYETLTGQKPFPDASLVNLIQDHLQTPVPLVSEKQPELSSQVDLVIKKATAKQPSLRYADVLEMAEEFRAAIQRDGPIRLTPVAAKLYNPYKGLRAFQESDRDDYFGREALVDTLIGRLADSRFLAVVGPSGSGKSSAVKAGLIPLLRSGAIPGSEEWFVAEMTPGVHPLEELELALWPIAVDPPPSLIDPMSRDERGMTRTIRRILPGQNGTQLLLVIDQFEELFTLVDDEKRRDFFIKSLLTAIEDPRSPLIVVITLRADFYDRPLQHQILGELLKESTEVVLPLSAEELFQAIQAPAQRVGVGFEEGLVAAMVADVTDQPGVLPLLQYALTEMFEGRQDHTLTRAAYDKIGGVSGALGSRADQLYEGFDSQEQAAARQLFLRLVRLGEGVEDTRRKVPRSELEEIDVEQLTNNDELQGLIIGRVIDAYGAARLLTFDHDPLTRQPTVEVAHEALLREWKRLRGWLDESRNDVRMQRMLAVSVGEWLAADRDSGFLLREARLDQFAGWAETSTVALTGNEQAYLTAGIDARETRIAKEEARRQRELETAQMLAETESKRAEEQAEAAGRLRRRALFLAGALIVAAILALAALFLANQSNQNAIVAGENADLAATRESDALWEASARATAQVEAEAERKRADEQRDVAVLAQAEAQAEVETRSTAEAVAINEREAAEVQARLATSRELAAAAVSNLDVDPELSILLSLEALAVTDTLQAQNALHLAIPASPVELTIDAIDGAIGGVAFSPDGERLATSGGDGEVMIWDVFSGQKILSLLGHDSFVAWVAFSPDGSRLASGAHDNKVIIWDSISGEILHTLSDHNDWVTTVAFSPDGQLLATSSEDGIARIWDTSTGERRVLLDSHHGAILNITFSPDGSFVATASDDQTAKLWDVVEGSVLLTLSHPVIVSGVEFSPDGRRLATQGNDGTVRLWELTMEEDVLTGDLVLTLFGASSGTGISTLNFTPDGKRLLAVGANGLTKIWDAFTGQELDPVACRPKTELALDLSPNGEHVAVAGANGMLKICNLSPRGELLDLSDHGDWVYQVAFSRDGSRLYSSVRGGDVKEWDLDEPGTASFGQELRNLNSQADTVFDLDISPDGTRLVTASSAGRPRIWDLETGEILLTLRGHDDAVWAVAYSPDGKYLATGSDDRTVRLWDAETGEELRRLVGHTDGLDNVAFSPDGKYLASVAVDNLLKLWDANTGQLLRTIVEKDWLWGLDFSPDGNHLVTAGNEAVIRLWDIEGLASGKDSAAVREFTGHAATIPNVSFSPDGSRLASVSFDNTVRLWDVDSGQELLTLHGHQDTVWGVAFSPDGKRLASASWDGSVRVYSLDLEELINMAESRVTRSLTDEECRQYLHVDTCPTNDS